MSFIWSVIGNLISFVLFGLWLRSVIVRRLRPQRILADLEQEVSSLITEVNRTGDANVTLIEDRIALLNRRVEVFDRHMQRCRELIEDADRAMREIEARQVDALHNHQNAPSLTEPDSDEEVIAFAFAGGASVSHAEAMDVHAQASETTIDARQRVLALYERGFSADVISVRTGIAIGEVELILSLHQRRSIR